MIGVPLLVLGLLLVLTAFGARDQEADRDRGVVARFIRSPLDPATWQATAAIVAGFWVELFAFVTLIGLLSVGVSALFAFGLGVVFIALAIEGARLVARIERRRATFADRTPLIAHRYRPFGSGLRDLGTALFLDRNRWRDVGYVFVAFPLTVLEFVAVIVLWTLVLALLSVPVWFVLAGSSAGLGLPAVADAVPFLARFGSPSTTLVGLASFAAGVLLLPVAASTAQGLMTLHRAVVAGLLCDSATRVLEQRVETLEESRRAVLEVEASELRRIERDLHDGAQQRLVLLTMNLGLAADRIATDPDGASELVVDAREQARLALAEIRDLVRGIAPAILMDRGLVAALAALAGRSPVPTVVLSSLPQGERLPDAVERGAYFVVAEALVNVAKHAAASRCEIDVRREGPLLVVEVRDDGRGGAQVLPAGGLAGLAGRVEALDGWLTVTSPAGGPTTVRAAIPAARQDPR